MLLGIVALCLLVACQWAPLDTTNGQPTRWRCGPITYTVYGGPSWLTAYTNQIALEVSVLSGRSITPSSFGNILVLWTDPLYPNAQADTQVLPGDGPYTSGIIRVSPSLESVRPTSAGRYATLRHEWGHVMGLAHVNDATEVMHPSAPPVSDGYGPGTRSGLQSLGAC